MLPTADAEGHHGQRPGRAGPGVIADAARLHQVVWNLLSNAVKFTPTGGCIDVLARRAGAIVEIEVRDTGIGIRPSSFPHLFERFSQADDSPRRQNPGLGLGLAIVRHLVEAHGGTVAAESAGENLGSTFIVQLPAAAPRDVHRAPAGAAAAAPRSRAAWPASGCSSWTTTRTRARWWSGRSPSPELLGPEGGVGEQASDAPGRRSSTCSWWTSGCPRRTGTRSCAGSGRTDARPRRSR